MISADDQPLISVIIPAVSGWESLGECLQSLAENTGDAAIEVIVADSCGDPTRDKIRNQFPKVRMIAAEGRPSIPALRGMAIPQARGHMVAIIEDHCMV